MSAVMKSDTFTGTADVPREARWQRQMEEEKKHINNINAAASSKIFLVSYAFFLLWRSDL